MSRSTRAMRKQERVSEYVVCSLASTIRFLPHSGQWHLPFTTALATTCPLQLEDEWFAHFRHHYSHNVFSRRGQQKDPQVHTPRTHKQRTRQHNRDSRFRSQTSHQHATRPHAIIHNRSRELLEPNDLAGRKDGHGTQPTRYHRPKDVRHGRLYRCERGYHKCQDWLHAKAR